MRSTYSWAWATLTLAACAQAYAPERDLPGIAGGPARVGPGSRASTGMGSDGTPTGGAMTATHASGQPGGADVEPPVWNTGVVGGLPAAAGAAATCEPDADADCVDRCLGGSDPFQCDRLMPSNLDSALLDLRAAPAINLDCGTTTVDTTGAGAVYNWCGSPPQLVVQGDVMAMPVSALNIAAEATLRVVGLRPLVIVSGEYIRIAGTLDASAEAGEGGPGAGRGCGPSAGGPGQGDNHLGGGGGGGGGFGTEGGSGGIGMFSAAGAGGAARAELGSSPLPSGCPGGSGGGCSAQGGGAAGGTVQLSAYGTLAVSGLLRAVGAAGAHGCGSEGGGSGGGSGGGFFLEAMIVDVTEARFDLAGGQGGAGAGGGRGGAAATSAGEHGKAGKAHWLNGGGGGGGGYGLLSIWAQAECRGC